MNLSAAAAALSQHPDFRVITRMEPLPRFAGEDLTGTRLGVIVDTETTGKDPTRDRVVELGVVCFRYNDDGQVLGVVDSYCELQDPGIPIPPDATRVNGITDEMVRGRAIDVDRVTRMVADAELVIAHNASFDRPFLEPMLPVLATLPWGCSRTDIDWEAEGIGSAKLDYVCYRFGFFYETHRAEQDCLALLRVLGMRLPLSGLSGLYWVAQRARQPLYYVRAVGAPFEVKDELKRRGYQWLPLDPRLAPRAWAKLVSAAELPAELQWLSATACNGQQRSIRVDTVTAVDRFTGRVGTPARADG